MQKNMAWKSILPNFPLLMLALSCTFCHRGSANVNFYLPVSEVEDLFGADGMELFYIRDGIFNHNAINFMAHVSDKKQTLNFVWKALYPDITVWYELKFPTPIPHHGSLKNAQNILSIGASINSSGRLPPNSEDKFIISLICSGEEDAELEVTIEIKFTIIDGPPTETVIGLKRLKKCKKHEPDPTLSKPNSNASNTSNPTENDQSSSDEVPPAPYDPTNRSHSQSTDAFYISISVVTFLIIMIVILVRVGHARASKRRQKAEAETCMMNRITSGPHHNQFLRPDLLNNATVPQRAPGSNASWMHFTPIINDLGTDIVEIRTKLSAIAVPKSDVVLEETLQEGTFSKIYRGLFEGNCQVLVKTVTDAASEEQTRLLLFESSLLRGMHHRNLLPIKSVVLDGPDPPMVLFPYTKGGNLKRYLRDIKFTDLNHCGTLSSGRRNYEQASTQDLVEMGVQVAYGMTYLAKRGLVHKDLATRNCVIDVNLRVKITDNALSRDLFPADYCCLGDNENRPVRWLAMESLVHKVYSTASDVWSFGVLLWELQSLAATPYNDIDDFEMSVYLRDGFRLSQPINCPDHLYNIMASCWHYSSDKRPTFSELLQMLTEFNAELGEYV